MRTNIFFFLSLFLTAFTKTFAQDANVDFTNRMNYIFQYMDKSKVATGLLADYGAQPLELEYFNGVPADKRILSLANVKKHYICKMQIKAIY